MSAKAKQYLSNMQQNTHFMDIIGPLRLAISERAPGDAAAAEASTLLGKLLLELEHENWPAAEKTIDQLLSNGFESLLQIDS